ncbi:MAG: hypothetical protein ACE5EH_04195 [Gammaproteobacteria bacterium]
MTCINKRFISLIACCLIFPGLSNEVYAVDKLELDESRISGNREDPVGLYILSWKNSEPGKIVDSPIKFSFDEHLRPLNRYELLRQIETHRSKTGSKPD